MANDQFNKTNDKKNRYPREPYRGELINGRVYLWTFEQNYDINHKTIVSIRDKYGKKKLAWGVDKDDERRVLASIGDYIVEASKHLNGIKLKISRVVYIDKKEQDVYIDVLHLYSMHSRIPRFKTLPLAECLSNIHLRLTTKYEFYPYCDDKLLSLIN